MVNIEDYEYEHIKLYKDRIRIFLIIYFFSEEYVNQKESYLSKVLYSEVKIQKIDFLLRNPDYLAYELIILMRKGKADRNDIKLIVKEIFGNKEPVIRKIEMEKFFFGAYEDIDDIILFLKGINFIEFRSERNIILKVINKSYYVTSFACEKMEKELQQIPSLQWYIKRCNLIKKYFGDFSGTQLKALQYEIDEYKNTSYKEYISDIQEQVKHMFMEEYKEEL